MTINEVGTRVQCPCGEWVELALQVGPARREGDKLVLPISFDGDQFTQDFEAHVLAEPGSEAHITFVYPPRPA